MFGFEVLVFVHVIPIHAAQSVEGGIAGGWGRGVVGRSASEGREVVVRVGR